jgi:transposase
MKNLRYYINLVESHQLNEIQDLDPETKQQFIDMFNKGAKQRELAAKFGLSKVQVMQLIKAYKKSMGYEPKKRESKNPELSDEQLIKLIDLGELKNPRNGKFQYTVPKIAEIMNAEFFNGENVLNTRYVYTLLVKNKVRTPTKYNPLDFETRTQIFSLIDRGATPQDIMDRFQIDPKTAKNVFKTHKRIKNRALDPEVYVEPGPGKGRGKRVSTTTAVSDEPKPRGRPGRKPKSDTAAPQPPTATRQEQPLTREWAVGHMEQLVNYVNGLHDTIERLNAEIQRLRSGR